VFKVGDLPNRWNVLNEYSKTIITLSSALLALTVTFSDKLVSVSATTYSRYFIAVSWILLLVSIIFGLLVAASVYNYLKKKETSTENTIGDIEKIEMNARKCANRSYVSFGLAAIVFVFWGLYSFQDAWDSTACAEKAVNHLVKVNKLSIADTKMISLEFDQGKETYAIEIFDKKSNAKYLVVIDINKKRIISAKKV
jgi:hypothetical protein